MTLKIDLNADIGESFGPWKMGNDTALLEIVTSANVACGFHAGDPDVMLKTMEIASNKDVGIGAHPGFFDLQGFGRHRLNLPIKTIQNQIRYQIGAAQAMARAVNSKLRHVKLHGALSNMASEDESLARACYKAILSIAPELSIIVLAATAQMEAAKEIGCNWVGEIFADRSYNDDATLVDRRYPDAMIHDAKIAGPRITKMIKEGAIISKSGKRIKTKIDTICLHGDTPEAIEIAGSVKTCLENAGIQLAKFQI